MTRGVVDRDALPDDWASDATLDQLAQKYGCHRSTVSRAATAMGLPPRKARTYLDRDAVREAWLRGDTAAVIAARLGCAESSVNTLARRMNLPRRQSRADDTALVGGRWVPDGRGVMRWQPS